VSLWHLIAVVKILANYAHDRSFYGCAEPSIMVEMRRNIQCRTYRLR